MIVRVVESDDRVLMVHLAGGWVYPVDTAPGVSTQEVNSWASRGGVIEDIRFRRNAKLAACDWTQLPDSPLSAEGKEAWAVYRQVLRDIPATCPTGAVRWPTEP